ncbi:hypothetical protein JCM8547_007620 [Rhodosporidiobolus lusitaniae]
MAATFEPTAAYHHHPHSRSVSPNFLSSSSSSSHPSIPRPRTVLPPLSSLSLPGSPLSTPPSSFPTQLPPLELHHPRPQLPPPNPHAPPPLLAPQPGPVPDAAVYARAYELLREKWAGCEGDIRQVANAASAALENQQRERKRRSRSWEDSVLDEKNEHVRVEEEREEKRSRLDDLASVAFFDNPAPQPSSSSHSSTSGVDAHPARPSLDTRTRSRSLPSSPAPPPSSSSCTLSHSHGHTTFLSSSLGASTRPLQARGSFSGQGGRSEALLSVVQSFETVLACRAESWRRLAATGRGMQ